MTDLPDDLAEKVEALRLGPGDWLILHMAPHDTGEVQRLADHLREYAPDLGDRTVIFGDGVKPYVLHVDEED